MIKTILRRGIFAIVILLLIIQLVPYGRDHTNPPVTAGPPWDSSQTHKLAKRACYDCHSNETVWPWYSHIAPASWLVQRDVEEGRSKLNFSEWNRPQKDADEAAEVVREGEMPLWFYVPLHSQARLSADRRQALSRGLTATIEQSESQKRQEREEHKEAEEKE